MLIVVSAIFLFLSQTSLPCFSLIRRGITYEGKNAVTSTKKEEFREIYHEKRSIIPTVMTASKVQT